MLDSNLKKKVLYYIEKNANGREIVLYGEDNSVQEMLNENGYSVKKIFTGRKELFKMNPEKFFDVEALYQCEYKCYVVLPFLLEDGGVAQRNTMKRLGYSKYYDYIFVPNDEDIDLALHNIRLNSKDREVVSFGYDPNVEKRLAQHGIEIKMRFSSNQAILENDKLNCHNSSELKNQSSRFYVVFPFVNDDNGQWQRYIMKEYGFSENIDYCFLKQPKHFTKSSQTKNNDKRLFTNNQEIWYDCFFKKIRSDRKLEAKKINNGILLPIINANPNFKGGVCDENFNFIAGHIHDTNTKETQCWVYDSYKVTDKIDYIDETVVFGGVMFDHPGHLIYECISNRLWWYVNHPESQLKIAFCPSWGDKSWSMIKEMLALIGIPENRIIFIEKPTKFKEIIIPEQSIYPKVDFTQEYTSVVEHIKKKLTPGKFEKIYLTRRKVSKQDTINEEYFIDFFEKRGYQIIDPEDYTIAEKASMMYGAKEVASLLGTNTLYCAFCNPEVKLIMLARCSDQFSREQAIINEAFGIDDIYIVDVSLSFLYQNRIRGINFIGPTNHWERFVKEFFEEQISETSEDTLSQLSYQYLKRCATYYSDPKMFNYFKQFDHFAILNLMNEVFYDKSLDEQKYNRNTQDINLHNSLNSHICALNFFVDLVNDSVAQQKFIRNIYDLKGKKIAILCNNIRSGIIFEKIIKHEEIDIIFSTPKKFLQDLSDDEWSKCLAADVIFNCNIHNINAGERNGKTAIPISSLLIREPISQTSQERFKQEILELREENQQMRQETLQIIDEENKIKEQMALSKKENAEYSAKLVASNEQLTLNLTEASVKLAAFSNQIKDLESERDALQKRLFEIENSRSWRYTRIFRKKQN